MLVATGSYWLLVLVAYIQWNEPQLVYTRNKQPEAGSQISTWLQQESGHLWTVNGNFMDFDESSPDTGNYRKPKPDNGVLGAPQWKYIDSPFWSKYVRNVNI